MAKTKNLAAAMKDLEKNYKKVLKDAMQYATDKAVTDVRDHALTCLEEYYAYDPTSYDRTYSLKNAFVPYKKPLTMNQTHITSTVGIMYNYSLLTTYEVGSNNYGSRDIDDGKKIIPINEWIMNNYLDGIHPGTNGYPTKMGTKEVVYYEVVDPVSPTEKMNNFLEQYVYTFRDNVYSYLAAYIMR